MGVSLAAVGTYFAGAGAATAATGGLEGIMAATVAESAVAGGAYGAGTAAAIEAGTIGGAAVAGGGLLGAAATSAGTAAASAGVSSLLAPKPPKVPGAVAMPDPLAQEEARKRSIAEQMARRGRASTILTAPASGGKLGD